MNGLAGQKPPIFVVLFVCFCWFFKHSSSFDQCPTDPTRTTFRYFHLSLTLVHQDIAETETLFLFSSLFLHLFTLADGMFCAPSCFRRKIPKMAHVALNQQLSSIHNHGSKVHDLSKLTHLHEPEACHVTSACHGCL